MTEKLAELFEEDAAPKHRSEPRPGRRRHRAA